MWVGMNNYDWWSDFFNARRNEDLSRLDGLIGPPHLKDGKGVPPVLGRPAARSWPFWSGSGMETCLEMSLSSPPSPQGPSWWLPREATSRSVLVDMHVSPYSARKRKVKEGEFMTPTRRCNPSRGVVMDEPQRPLPPSQCRMRRRKTEVAGRPHAKARRQQRTSDNPEDTPG
jgi:hypothetical protein